MLPGLLSLALTAGYGLVRQAGGTVRIFGMASHGVARIPRDPRLAPAQAPALLPIFLTFQVENGGEAGHATY